jgi:hypothetical protein
MRDTNKFRTLAKQEIVKIEKDLYNREISHEEIQLVFLSYVLGQMKATMVVAQNTQGRYYEVSYSCINHKMFIDIYKQTGSKVVIVEGEDNV